MGERDRREFKRVSLDVICAVIMPNGVKHAAMARNLSIGGVFLECDRPLAKGEQVKVAINLPMGGRLQKIEVDIEVIHGPSRVSVTAFGSGVRFLGLDGEQLELVERYVDARPAVM